VLTLNDHHARAGLSPAEPLQPGEIARFAIRHPCTALGKWRLLPLLDDGDLVTGALLTFF
jgi:D-serine deaminase-like pyridoxal phosphate-dependent protein